MDSVASQGKFSSFQVFFLFQTSVSFGHLLAQLEFASTCVDFDRVQQFPRKSTQVLHRFVTQREVDTSGPRTKSIWPGLYVLK